jgi:HSP20 family molecular chaperone IbpA
MSKMSEDAGFEGVLAEMLRLAERLFGEELQGEGNAEAESERGEEELIVGRDYITYVLDARGYSKEDLLVSVLEDEIEVKGPDFIVKKRLPESVVPDTAVSTFRNGLLSVRVKKK